jgi:flagellar basal-body rod protein FlgC
MIPDRMFSTFKTAAQGMAVQREKIAVAARNIAHAGTTAPVGSPDAYRVQSVVTSIGDKNEFHGMLLENIGKLVKTNENHQDLAEAAARSGGRNLGPQMQIVEREQYRFEFDPNHPDADENGMVRYADVDLIQEMTQIVSANRLYEANVSVVEAEKQILRRTLDI